MTYLVSQLWFCLLLAWMLGNIIGWLLRGGCSAHIKRVEENWRDRYLMLEEEKESYVVQVNRLRGVDHEADSLTEKLAKYQAIEQLNSQLKSHITKVERGTKAIQVDLRIKTQALAKCQNILGRSKKVITAKDETLHKLASRLKIERQQLNRCKQQLSMCGVENTKCIDGLKTGLDDTQLKLDELAQKFADAAAELVNAKASLLEKSELLKEKNNALEEQDESLEILTATVRTRDEMVDYYEKQLDERSTENSLLTNKLESLANEFAKVASAMMQAKSVQSAENKRHKEEKKSLVVKFNDVETKLIAKLAEADKVLEQKEYALQKMVVTKQSKSKLHQLERQLKHMKKKFKAIPDDYQDANLLIPKDSNKDSSKNKALDSDKFDAKTSKMTLSGMCYDIEKIRGIGSGYEAGLREMGIKNSHDLLQYVSSNQQIQTIAEKISSEPSDIILWKKMADFLRIKGVTVEFSHLLALTPLNSVQDIAVSNAMQLLDKMRVARKTERRIRHMPELEDINKWIHDAKTFEG